MRYTVAAVLPLIAILLSISACVTAESERIAGLEATIAAMSREQQEQASPPVQEPYPTSTPYPPPSPLPTYTPLPTPTPAQLTDLPGAYNYRDIPRPPNATIWQQEPIRYTDDLHSDTLYIVSEVDASCAELVTWALEEIPAYGWRHTKTSDMVDDMRFWYDAVGVNYTDKYAGLIVFIAKIPEYTPWYGNWTVPPPGYCGVLYHLHLRREDWSIFQEH